MTRSSWKESYLSYNLIRNQQKQVSLKGKPLRIYNRGFIIPKELVGKTVEIYNGKIFITRQITNEMTGHKFGELSYTRVKYEFKKKRKKNKNTLWDIKVIRYLFV